VRNEAHESNGSVTLLHGPLELVSLLKLARLRPNLSSNDLKHKNIFLMSISIQKIHNQNNTFHGDVVEDYRKIIGSLIHYLIPSFHPTR
jgi:hypothetical protein